MPGGPVNGVPWTGTLQLTGTAGIASAARRGADQNDPANYTGIIIPTVLQIANDALRYWTSLTCLYDRYWSAEAGRVTLPVCVFHVKKITPARTVETSKRRVILYEPQGDGRMGADKHADPMRPGVMRTVVDNAVKQPTAYTMEIIVPFQPVGRYVTDGIKIISDMIAGISDLFSGDASEGFADVWGGYFSSVFSLLKNVNTITDTAGKMSGMAGKMSGMDGKLPGTDMEGVSYINMNSLEAMADSCRTLCMKMWTGYDYKYVMITGMTYDKNPAEDNVFRASLSLQEMPVLAVSRPASPKPDAIDRNWAVTAVSVAQGALVTPLLALTGVKDAAGGGESGVGRIKNTLGV
jgi:hypothetical protein